MRLTAVPAQVLCAGVDSARANRDHWNRISVSYQAEHDPQIGATPRLWGAFSIEDHELGALGEVRGRRVLEVGCGGGQWSSSLAGDAGHVVGFDVSEAQLAAARQSMGQVRYLLVQGAAERLPFADASFDLVLSDHGGLSWAPPQVAVPEAARVLRPEGRLVVNHFSPLAHICYDAAADMVASQLHRDYFGLGGVAQPDGAVNYQLTYGGWIRVLRDAGLVVDNLIEPRPQPGQHSGYYDFSPPDWATRWPCETLWVAHKP
jgi:ubiquinone/menaquinone biosynthesis C-methylase UbiE